MANSNQLIETIRDIVNFSFSWMKDKEMQKLYLGLLVAYFALSLFTITKEDPLAFLNFEAIGTFGIVALFVMIVAFIASLYFSFKVLFKTMNLKFSKLRSFNLESVVMLIVLQILTFFAGLFSVFELKWLALLGAAILFGIAGAFSPMLITAGSSSAFPVGLLGAVLLVLSAICAVAYFVIIMRNAVRLSPAAGLYLQGKGLTASLSESWKTTPGKALKIFAIFLVSGVIVMVLTGVELLISAIFTLIEGEWVISEIGVRPFSAFLSALLSAFSAIFQTFTYVGMLVWLFGAKRGVKTKVAVKHKK